MWGDREQGNPFQDIILTIIGHSGDESNQVDVWAV